MTTNNASEPLKHAGAGDVGDMPPTTTNNHQHANLEPALSAAPDDLAATNHSLKVGDRVLWDDCPGHCSWGNPFIITAV